MARGMDALSNIAVKEARNEITDYTIYKTLAGTEENNKLAGIFSKLYKMEYGHYEFWKRYCKDSDIQPENLKVNLVLFLRRIFGATFIIKYLESGETTAIKKYEALRKNIPKDDRKRFEQIIGDEREHELAFAGLIQGERVRYMSFIVLGLADALVEVAGIHAGSLGIYNSTVLTGLAGIVAGAAASISMASAAYAQSKHGFQGSSLRAAAYTGVSYFISAAILATPYFLTGAMSVAFSSSLLLGFLIIAFVSWYNAVVSGSSAKRDFFELAGVMVLASIALFLFGTIIRGALGISI